MTSSLARMAALARRGIRDLSPAGYLLASGATPDGSGPYPLDWRMHATDAPQSGTGIVLTHDRRLGHYENPVAMCLHALGRHADWCDGDGCPTAASAAEDFLRHAGRLLLTQDDAGGWRYPVPVLRYGVAPGWRSAMAQGLTASVFLRAGDMTGDPAYPHAAQAAVALMLRPVEAGGCACYDAAGRPFFEECPSVPPSRVLNGALFALIGLWELEERTGVRARERALARLRGDLPQFDLGYWSAYDLRFRSPATRAYHRLHVSLLQAMAQFSGDPTLGSTATRWQALDRRPVQVLRAALGKAAFAARREVVEAR